MPPPLPTARRVKRTSIAPDGDAPSRGRTRPDVIAIAPEDAVLQSEAVTTEAYPDEPIGETDTRSEPNPAATAIMEQPDFGDEFLADGSAILAIELVGDSQIQPIDDFDQVPLVPNTGDAGQVAPGPSATPFADLMAEIEAEADAQEQSADRARASSTTRRRRLRPVTGQAPRSVSETGLDRHAMAVLEALGSGSPIIDAPMSADPFTRGSGLPPPADDDEGEPEGEAQVTEVVRLDELE